MTKATRKRGEKALKDTIRTLDQTRGLLVRRLNDVDVEAVRKQGAQLAGSARAELERRMRPRPRRRFTPGTTAGIAGAMIVGLAAVGIGYVLYDRERREAARARLTGVRSRARQRYAELTGGRSQVEADLEDRVRRAIAEGGMPPAGLDVVVEGRTVYLRGAVTDPAYVDAAAERIHGVDGVVAVVNLTTGSSPNSVASAAKASRS
jgi:hypothetical protein